MSSQTDKTPAKPDIAPLKSWKVLVHNDDVNTYNHVILTFLQLLKMDLPTAVRKTVEVDKKGLSIVAVTHREHAELLQEQLQSKGLTSTIEPD